MVQKTPVFKSGTSAALWGDASAWNPAGVPTAADDVVIAALAPTVSLFGGGSIASSVVALNSMAAGMVQFQSNSITLTDSTSKLVISPGASVNGGRINLVAGSIRLATSTVSGLSTATINGSTIQLNGGTLTGTGILDNDTFQGTLNLSPLPPKTDADFLNTLTIANRLTLDPTRRAGLVAPGGSIVSTAPSSSGFAALDGGVLLAGAGATSLNTASLQATGAPLLLGSGLGLDVVGQTQINSATQEVTDAATNTVGPGGILALSGTVISSGSYRIYSGSLNLANDTAGQVAPYAVQMDDNAANLVVNSGQSITVRGFRAGDTIDVVGVATAAPSTKAATADTTSLTLGTGTISLIGPVQAGATYTTASDGNGGTLITTNAAPAAAVAFLDSSLSETQGGTHALDAVGSAAGGPSYLQWRYIDAGPDQVAISSATPNTFLRGGSGLKALQVTNGRNILDGGTGSSFLTGGSGNDTFFVDTFYGTPVADTIRNFHAGDAVTVWGFVPGTSSYAIDATGGAPGFTGSTVRILNQGGGVAATITFTGMSAAQVSGLQVATGTQAAGSYLYFYNPGV